MEETIAKWLKDDVGLYDRFYKDFVQAPDKAKWWISHRGTFRDFPGYKQVNSRVSVQPLKDRLVKSLDEEDWSKASKAYKEDVAEELGTTVDKLNDAWNEHLEDVKKSNEIQARADEVENWPLYKILLASEYAKQRYINEPEKSIFSDEGEWYNKGEDVSDLIYGGAGAVGDLLPGIGGTVVGPFVRGVRDVQHKVTNSDYQKDWDKMGKDIGMDLMLNVGADLAPSMLIKKGERYVGNAVKDWKGSIGDELRKVSDYLQAEHDRKNMKKGWELLGDEKKRHELTSNPIKWDKAIDRLPDSSMKKDLKTLRDASREDKKNALDMWEHPANSTTDHPHIYRKTPDGELVLKRMYAEGEVSPSITEHAQMVLKGNDEAGRLTKFLAFLADASKPLAERVIKEAADYGGRGSTPEESVQAKLDRWSKGYATWDEKKSSEYKDWEKAQLKAILGLEE